jgi:hypothetical protein
MLTEKDRSMNARKKEKDRRRARKLAEQAWEAANQNNLDLALKIIRRAVDTQPDNPVLWNDQGVLLVRAGDDRGAEASFRAALSLAIDYHEPYAHLAAIRVRQNRLDDAVALQTRAARSAPDHSDHAERLDAYRALAGQLTASPSPLPLPAPAPIIEEIDSTTFADLEQRLAALDWHALGQRLTREGGLLLSGLLDSATCAQARNWFDEDERFAKTVVMDRPDFGRGTYRYFKAPLPPLVDGLRRAVYPHAARIANRWQALLGEEERFSEEWEVFRDVCRAAGQSTPTPILLKYEAGGFNALHRDLRGAVYFPIQLAIVLSPRAVDGSDGEGFHGGDFLLCDVPEGPKARRRALAAGLGDAVLFCTRDRLETVGSTWGLQPVMHGVTPITAGNRYVLGVPFHEYR